MWQRILVNYALKRAGIEPEKIVEEIVAKLYVAKEQEQYDLGDAIADLARQQSRARQSASKLRRAQDALGSGVETA